MNSDDIKKIRQALGLSKTELGAALGLDGAHVYHTVRSWETGSRNMSGPTAKLLTYMAQGALDDAMKCVIPEHIQGVALGPDSDTNQYQYEYIIRLWRPRFIGFVLPGEFPLDITIDWCWIAKGLEKLAVIMWMDDPNDPPGFEKKDMLLKAASLFECHTQDVYCDKDIPCFDF